MGLRTALTHGSVLHAGLHGAEVCSTPRRMEVYSTPSCWTPRAAPGWKCAPHPAAIVVVLLKEGRTVGPRGYPDLDVYGGFTAAPGRRDDDEITYLLTYLLTYWSI